MTLRLVRFTQEEIESFAARLAASIQPGWFTQFVNDRQVVVVLAGRYFVLNKLDRSTWKEMLAYGVSQGVAREWLLYMAVDPYALIPVRD